MPKEKPVFDKVSYSLASQNFKDDLQKLRIVDLKPLLEGRNLSASGKKSILIQRLVDNPTDEEIEQYGLKPKKESRKVETEKVKYTSKQKIENNVPKAGVRTYTRITPEKLACDLQFLGYTGIKKLKVEEMKKYLRSFGVADPKGKKEELLKKLIKSVNSHGNPADKIKIPRKKVVKE